MTPLVMVCPICNGSGCQECNGQGRFEIPACPLDYVTEDVWDVIRLAELFEKGLPPVAGGVLDQAVVFVEAANFIRHEINYWKSETKGKK